MHTLAIDIETYSSYDLKKVGVYKYVESPEFDIILFAYSLDNAPVKIFDLTERKLPTGLISYLNDPACIKSAHNANFERVCLSKYLDYDLRADQWQCTMVRAASFGWPLGLEAIGKAMSLPKQKDAEGKALIRYFCGPCKPSKTNGMRTRNLPEHAPDKWEAFKRYCIIDVEVEREIVKRLRSCSLSESEQDLYVLDQKINDVGIKLDPVLPVKAININIDYTNTIKEEARKISGIVNMKSAPQLKRWLQKEMPLDDIENVRKEQFKEITEKAKSYENEAIIARVLKIRSEVGKTSIQKYEAMLRSVCKDLRVRGMLQFGGANRTMRWAGRLIQVQNLPQNHLKDLDLARRIARSGDGDFLALLFGNVPDTLSQLIRTSFVTEPGKTLIMADLSAIEACLLSWLAGQTWRMKVFNTTGKIYEAAGAQMFRVPIEKVTKGSEYRQRAKICELALGYGGGPKALITAGALRMGIPEDDLPKLVRLWRQTNPDIVKYWYKVEEAMLKAMNDEPARLGYGVKFYKSNRTGVQTLFIQLPSGRELCYVDPRLYTNERGKPALTYMGLDRDKGNRWARIDTWGGKLTENIVQAIQRDLLADAMLRMDKAGFKIVMHVHDELVIEGYEEDLEEVNAIMNHKAVKWAPDLPLRAESYTSTYYRKDG